MISRGEVYWASLPLDSGETLRKPVLIVSRNAISRGMKPVVARISAEPRVRHFPTSVTVTRDDLPLPDDESWVLLHDFTTIPVEHLLEQVGQLGVGKMLEVEAKPKYTFDLE